MIAAPEERYIFGCHDSFNIGNTICRSSGAFVFVGVYAINIEPRCGLMLDIELIVTILIVQAKKHMACRAIQLASDVLALRSKIR